MRRTLISLMIVPVILLAIAAPTMAGNPTRNGVSTSFRADSRSCDETTCTFFSLTAHNADSFGLNPDYLRACLTVITESRKTGRVLDRAHGCVWRNLSALMVANDLAATFGPTRIGIRHSGGTRTRVLVASVESATGPLAVVKARLQADADGCVYRYLLHQAASDIGGRLRVRGVTLPSTGFVSVRQYKTKLLHCN